ncbi:MAG: hypothetical protein QM723_11785 [Myxococcaceae bacterium]
MRYCFRLLPLAALLVAGFAHAQKVVILEIEGDKNGKLRDQVQTAVEDAGQVTLLSIEKWRAAASKKKLSGAKGMTPAAVTKLAKKLGVSAAVGGSVGPKFSVHIWAWDGSELWTKELKVKKGLLSDDFSRKLSKAITAAAKTAPAFSDEGGGDEGDEGEGAGTGKTGNQEQSTVGEGVDLTGGSNANNGSRTALQPGDDRDKRRREEEAEAAFQPKEGEGDADLAAETQKKKTKVGPKAISVWLGGTTTWRSYCSRPGVSSCAQYKKVMPPPQGDTVDFSPQVPYAGFQINAEAFPLVLATDNPFLQGIGVTGYFGLGFSLTNVKVQSPSGSTPDQQVVSTDRNWAANLAWRYYFSFLSGKDAVPGYAGIHFGGASRVFEIDANAKVPLPGSYRVYPQLGLDFEIPVIKYLKFDGSFSYFINPRPGPDEILGYGNPSAAQGGAAGKGFGFDLGVSGAIWGPIGYKLLFRYVSYADQFFGQGKKWTICDSTQCGGAAEELYYGLIWGITASF